MKYRFLSLIKLVAIGIALALAVFLALGENTDISASDQKVVFVLDINRTMNTEDLSSGTQQISRLSAAKSLITQSMLSEPNYSYGLIIFNASADYILPPTFDTGTFLLYLSGITTNLLPEGNANFAHLSGFLHRAPFTSYLIISDFDAMPQGRTVFPQGTKLLGIGSLVGDKVRYSNGLVYFENGKSVFSVRNDQFARALDAPYLVVSQMSVLPLDMLLSHGLDLPLTQRVVLYVILGILVIIVVLF